MYESICIANMKREDWLKLRKAGIGGSDAGAICGLNPYSTPMSVYRDKTSVHISDEDNEAMRQGRDLEDYVARRFMELTGLKVRRSNMMYRSREHPFMIADVDRLIVGEDAGLECKTASAYNADKWKNGEVPAHYLVQCHHYMAVTGKNKWYIAVVILGQGFQYAEIKRDQAVINDLISIEEAFWNVNVKAGVMPDPDGSKICDEIIARYYPSAKKGQAVPLIGFDKKLERRQEIDVLIKKLEIESNQIDQEIKIYMEEAESAVSDKFRVSWSSYESARLDSKRLKSEQPEIYQKFSATNQSRRFMVRVA